MSIDSERGFAIFQPRARLLKLIGAELISDEVVAITELVKNAHDADASFVKISFCASNEKGGTIEVADDGTGMDRETLLRSWMEPAGSTKREESRRVTPKGRRVLGEKGLGRFAADKLGRKLELISRRDGSGAEIIATFDWDEFDDPDRMLDSVQSRWELRPARELDAHGTVLRISGLRAAWNERMFRRLSLRLGRLRSPTRGHGGFRIEIESDTFPEYSGEVATDFLGKAPYRAEATFDGRNTIAIEIAGHPTLRQPWIGNGPLACGPVRMVLHGFDLETEALAKIGPRMEVRAWLREWTGVSVYRDGFRVWPYGEPHDDWLRLDQRRVNNPVVRLSNNQIVGFVEITGDGNPDLKDQTNREGLVNNQALEDLRRLIHYVLQFLEAERQTVRHPKVRQPASRAGPDSLVDEIERIAQAAPSELQARLRKLAVNVGERLDRQAAHRDSLSAGYSSLAAYGQAAVGLGRDSSAAVVEAAHALAELRKEVGSSPSASSLVYQAESALEALRKRHEMLAAMEGAALRRRTIDVVRELGEYRSIMLSLIAERGASFEIVVETDELVRAEVAPEVLRAVLHALLTNSFDWHVDGHLELKATVSADCDRCEIVFTDNGPGVPSEISTRIFEPMFSLKEGGRGMGLTVAKEILERHGGNIELVVDRRRRGAAFRIVLPRKRARAEPKQQ